MELFLFLGSLFAFLFVGIPISMVLVLCSIVLMWHSGMWDSMIIPSTMLDGANNYPLMAIPFFVFAGEIMAEGGLSKRVVQLAQLMIGRVRGGLGYAAIISSVIFAGLMGSSVGEAAALGGLLLPMMAEVGYKPGRAGGGVHLLGRAGAVGITGMAVEVGGDHDGLRERPGLSGTDGMAVMAAGRGRAEMGAGPEGKKRGGRTLPVMC